MMAMVGDRSARRTARLADTKTGASLRPLSELTDAVIQSQPRIGDLVFPSSSGETPFVGYWKMWLKIAALGDLPADITPHVLRHSFASLATDLGYNEPATRRLGQELRGVVIADMRLTSLTLAADTFSSLAVSRTPRPSSNARRMRCTWNGVVLGLPRRLPDDRARSSPASTRSRIIARSNSLNTPSIPNNILPDGVEVSRPCWCR